MGLAGASRCDELSKILIDDTKNSNKMIIVKISDSKCSKPTRYVMVHEEKVLYYNLQH